MANCKRCGRFTANPSFCNRNCANGFQAVSREDDACELCGRVRKELPIMLRCFSKGMCQQCYASMRDFGGDRELALLHVASKRLQREVKYAERKVVRSK